jgi:hypothetical protein
MSTVACPADEPRETSSGYFLPRGVASANRRVVNVNDLVEDEGGNLTAHDESWGIVGGGRWFVPWGAEQHRRTGETIRFLHSTVERCITAEANECIGAEGVLDAIAEVHRALWKLRIAGERWAGEEGLESVALYEPQPEGSK